MLSLSNRRPLPWYFIIASFAGLSGCEQSDHSPANGKPAQEVAVIRAEAIVVKPQIWPLRARTQGSLVVDEVSSISAKVPGRVSQVHADLGDRVEKDSPLITIEDEQYRLLVAQAESQLAQARSAVGLRDGDPLEKLNPENAAPVREAQAVWDEARQAVERIRRLSQQNAVSATDLEVAESAERVAAARHTSAQNSVREKIALIGVQTAQLGLARQNLVDTIVRAPFSGIIQGRQVAVGTYVQPGQSLATLVSESPLRFRAAIPERFAHLLRVGQTVRMHVDLCNQSREVEITRISPTLDPTSRSLAFEAIVDNSDQSLRSGLFAEADVILDPNATAIIVPTAAVVRFAGVDKIWKVEGDMIRSQTIGLGQIEGDRSEILSGVQAGDRILADGKQGRVGRLEAIDAEDPVEQ
jgi:RND family efflux transporter MFP subunit